MRKRIPKLEEITEKFPVKVGLHQESFLSVCLFDQIVDVLVSDNMEKAPWSMLFADDIAWMIQVNNGQKRSWSNEEGQRRTEDLRELKR